MSDKNMAKEWQKGWYQINVCGNSVRVSTMRNGETYAEFSHCHPDDEFSLSEGVKIAIERLERLIDPDVIHVGDLVNFRHVNIDSYYYGAYISWVVKNVKNPEHIARWQFDTKCKDAYDNYVVRYIAPHGTNGETLAFIENCENRKCYLVSVCVLEKINE